MQLKQISLLLFVILITFSCKHPRKNAKVVEANKEQSTKDYSTIQKSDTDMMIGFNAPAIFYQYQNAKPSSEVIRLYKQLDADIIRFPGGTLANHYRFSKTGYGRNVVADKKYNENFIYEFVALMKQIMDEPKVIYVMNFFEHFGKNPVNENELIEENMKAVQFLQNSGIEIVAIELGNELYIYPEITNNWFKKKEGLEELSGENVNEYLRLAEKYARLIKEFNPAIKVGLPMGKFVNPLHSYWNEELLKADFTDAYISHFYGRVEPNCNQADCFRESMNDYMKKMERDITIIKKRTGKEIWITEWNAINFGFKGDKNLEFAHSPLHVEYNHKFLELFERNGVSICNYHRISGSSKKPAYNLISITPNNECKTNATYDAFLELSK